MVATSTPHQNATEIADMLTVAHSVHFIDHPPTDN